MKKCELCDSVARMYCDSDQASLCWACDHRVHMANFIVAKHIRTLLCHTCQGITPWKGSGSKLGPTVSVCESCVGRREDHPNGTSTVDNDDDDDDREYQVVPPLLVSSSSSSGESTSGLGSIKDGSNIAHNHASSYYNNNQDNKRPKEKKSSTRDVRSWRWR